MPVWDNTCSWIIKWFLWASLLSLYFVPHVRNPRMALHEPIISFIVDCPKIAHSHWFMNYLWPARPRTSLCPLSHFTSPYSEIWVTFNVPQQMLITLCACVMAQVQIGYPYPHLWQLVWKYENMMSLEPKYAQWLVYHRICVIMVNDYMFHMTIMS